jgi:uncharacterized protein YkwD
MKKHIPRLVSIALLGLFLVACTTTGQGTDAPAPPAMDAAEGRALAAQEVLRLINVERAKVGLSPYRTDPQYMEAAQIRADQIVETEHYSHWGLNGESAAIAALKASRARVGAKCSEILTYSGDQDPYSSAVTAIVSWMESERHKSVVVDDEFAAIGIGVAWAGSGMDFDPGPGEYFGVAGIYVIIACLEGETQLEDDVDFIQELRNDGKELDLSLLIEMRQESLRAEEEIDPETFERYLEEELGITLPR